MPLFLTGLAAAAVAGLVLICLIQVLLRVLE
jgi:hypothetical protein